MKYIKWRKEAKKILGIEDDDINDDFEKGLEYLYDCARSEN